MTETGEVTKVLVAIAELRGELRGYAERTAATEQKVAELDARLRGAATDAEVRALEGRVRAQETRSLVTPSGLVLALTTTIMALGGLFALVPKFS